MSLVIDNLISVVRDGMSILEPMGNYPEGLTQVFPQKNYMDGDPVLLNVANDPLGLTSMANPEDGILDTVSVSEIESALNGHGAPVNGVVANKALADGLTRKQMLAEYLGKVGSEYVYSTTLRSLTTPSGTMLRPETYGLPYHRETVCSMRVNGALMIAGTSDCLGLSASILSGAEVHIFTSPSKPLTSSCTPADKAELYRIVEAYTGIQPTNAGFVSATSGTIGDALQYAYKIIGGW